MFATNMKDGVPNTQHLNNPRHLISVIVLTYKNQEHLIDTISSILNQDYPRIELIISDDASGCLQKDEIQYYVNKNKHSNIENLIININKTNLGTVKHANLSIGYSKGDYIKFVSCGDKFYNSSSLRMLYEFSIYNDSPLTTSKVVVSSGNFKSKYYIHPNSYRSERMMKCSPKKLFKYLCVVNIIAAVSVLYRRDFFLKYKFDEKYRLLEDWPLWLNVSRDGLKINHLDMVTMYYSLGGVSSNDLNAYNSIALREDLRNCYKQEILPYINELSFFSKHYVLYKYESISNKRKLHIIKYAPFIIFDLLKCFIKRMLKRGLSNG